MSIMTGHTNIKFSDEKKCHYHTLVRSGPFQTLPTHLQCIKLYLIPKSVTNRMLVLDQCTSHLCSLNLLKYISEHYLK